MDRTLIDFIVGGGILVLAVPTALVVVGAGIVCAAISSACEAELK